MAVVVTASAVMVVVTAVVMTVRIVVGIPVQRVRLYAINTNPNLDIMVPNETSAVEISVAGRECVKVSVA